MTRRCKIRDIARTNTSTYSERENWDFVNYLDTGNITENKIDMIQPIITASEKLPSRARRKVKYNSIVYSTVRPNQKHYGIIKSIPQNLLVSTGFAVIEVDESQADADFIYYFLTHPDVVTRLQALAEQSTSTYPSIKPSDIEDLDIDLPELSTQRKIASILLSLDRKIQENTAINNNLAA